MRMSILALTTATLASAFLIADSASAQVAPLTKFQQLLEQGRITTVYTARGGGGRGAAIRRPTGMHRSAYRGNAYRGNVARGGVYRHNVARAGVYHRNYAGRYYHRPYAAYGRPYYRGAYYGRRYYGGYYRPYYGGSYYGYNYGYPYGYGAAAAAGALIGGAIASQPVVTGSVGGNAYCAQRYRSYDPASGTFLGYDGRRHPCP